MKNRRFRMIVSALVFLFGAGAIWAQTPSPAPQPWTPLQFLVGTWEGVGSGAPGEGRGGCTFAFDLNIFSIAMPGQDFKEYTRGWLVKK